MSLSRREFLKTLGLTAGAAAVLELTDSPFFLIERLEAAPLTTLELQNLAAVALERAKSAGCTYADIRINRYRTRNVGLRTSPDRSGGKLSGKMNHVPVVIEGERFGFGVRVLHSGTWGFAASPIVTKEEISKVASQAVSIAKANSALTKKPVQLAPVPAFKDKYVTPYKTNPFDVPVEQQLAYLQAVHDNALKAKGVSSVNSGLSFRTEEKYFASSEGSSIEQLILQTAPSCAATAVDFATRKSKSRSFQVKPQTAGWEHVESSGMRENAERMGAEAVEHLAAPSVEPGMKDLILMPSHLALTIHESIGHSTELDRALGYEANYAGTSFLAPPAQMIGKFQFGSPIVNVVGDRVLPGAMSTVGYDDDGVKATRWHIIKNGVFQAYQTTRDQAHWVGEKESRGCSYADSFDSVPFQRMPNVWLEPGPENVTLDDLITQVEDGILIDGRGSYSIDQQRYNFQFGGDGFWEIKNGKKGRMLADVAYQSRTHDFWSACAAIAGQPFWENVGLENDGKGQPSQTNAMSHGCAPALFKGIRVLRTE